MTSFSTSPRAPIHRHWPAVALLTLLLILSISHIYLQLAFPIHAVGLAAGLALLAAGMALIPSVPGDPRASLSFRSVPRPYATLFGLQAAWLLWTGIELIRAPVRALGRTEFATVFEGFLVFWIVAEAARRWRHVPAPDEAPRGNESATASVSSSMTPVQILALWWVFAGVALSAYAIYQVLGPAGWPKTFAALHDSIVAEMGSETVSDPILKSILYALREGRAFASFGAPNIFGGFLIAPLILLAGMGLSSRGTARRVLAGVGAAAMVWALVLSQSRGAMLALGAGIPFFALRYWRARPRSAGRPSALAVGTISAVLVVFLALRFCPGSAGAQTSAARSGHGAATQTAAANSSRDAAPSSPAATFDSPEHRTLLEHLLSISTVRQRLYYWRTALSIWARDPFTGGGCGAFEVFYPRFRRPGSGETVYAHSWFFQFGSETGMVGVAIFAAIAIVALIAAEDSIRRSGREGASPCLTRPPALLIAFEAGLVALLIHGLVDYTLSQRELYLDLQMVLGLLAGVMACRNESPAGPDSAEATVPPGGRPAEDADGVAARVPNAAPPAAAFIRPPRRGLRLAAALMATVPCGIIYMQNVIDPLYARFYATAARDVATEDHEPDGAIRLYRQSLDWEPDNPWTLASLGMAEMEAGRIRGLDFIERAARIHPESASIQTLLARGYDRAGSPARALDALRRAVDLHPLEADHRLDLAERLLREGKKDEARRQLDQAAVTPLLEPRQTSRIVALRSLLKDKPVGQTR